MQEIYRLLIGVAILLLGIPIGNILAKKTREELEDGKIWFIVIIAISFIGAVLNLIFPNDTLFFTFLFIAIVTSRSLRRKKKMIKKNRANKKRRKS